jgi:hypothetical protein
MTDQYHTGELGEMSAVLFRIGFVFTTDIKEILETRFKEESDPKECTRALQVIKEHRTLTLSKFLEWKSLLKSRFGQDIFKTCEISVQIDHEIVPKRLETRKIKHEALLLIRSIEWNDPDWKDRVQAWLTEAQEAYPIGFEKVYQDWLLLRQHLLRTDPCTEGTIDIMFDDPVSGQWKIITLRCTEPYRPQVLFEEIESWLHCNGGWNLRRDECWQIFDEDGQVDRGDLRNPRDGERFAVLIQEIDGNHRLEGMRRLRSLSRRPAGAGSNPDIRLI